MKMILLCFNLKKRRQGEICNACVLLVKRFKRLPAESNRHWGHVVDARIGPGMKSMTKFKKLREESLQKSSFENTKTQNAKPLKSFLNFFKKNKKKKLLEKSLEKEKREGSPGSWDEQSLPPTPESLNSDLEDTRYSSPSRSTTRAKFSKNRINRRKIRKPRRYRGELQNFGFFDRSEWKPIKSCCGIVYENMQFRALIIDIQSYKPCSDHIRFLHNISDVKSEHLNHAKTDTLNFERNNDLKHQLHLERPVSISQEETLIPTPVLKKHHLFFKRQLENFPGGEISVVNSIKTDLDSISNRQVEDANDLQSIDIINKIKPTLLHKIKSDTGKIVKHSLEKLNTLRIKQADISDIKNLLKIGDKQIKIRTLEESSSGQYNKQVDQPGNKFSDNSSDSGFDENLQERKSVSPMQEEEEKKLLIRPTQSMFLANSVHISNPPQNLILTASEVAAKMLQSRRQQSQFGTTKCAQSSGSQKIRAIFNPSPEGIVTLAAANPTTPTAMLNVTPSTASLNQKIIFVKAKYNQPSSN